jgi:hypothetical protein
MGGGRWIAPLLKVDALAADHADGAIVEIDARLIRHDQKTEAVSDDRRA